MIAIDYMGGTLDASAAKRAGVILVLRYVAPASYGWPKAMTSAELAALETAGFAVQPTWEGGTQNWSGGASQGRTDGLATAEALAELGLASKWIAVAYDMDIAPSSFPVCLAYAQAFYAACPIRQIPYGESALIAYLQANDSTITAGGWKCASSSFPSDPSAVLWLVQQIGGVPNIGVSNDVDTILVPYFQEVTEVSALTIVCPPGPLPTTVPLPTPGKDCTSGTLSFATDEVTPVELYVGSEGVWRDPGWHTTPSDPYATVVPAGRTLSCPLEAGDELCVVYNKGSHNVTALVIFQ